MLVIGDGRRQGMDDVHLARRHTRPVPSALTVLASAMALTGVSVKASTPLSVQANTARALSPAPAAYKVLPATAISSTPASPSTARICSRLSTAAVVSIWAIKWVDYSDTNQGFGYQLSDGSYGVLFRNETKMMLLGDGE